MCQSYLTNNYLLVQTHEEGKESYPGLLQLYFPSYVPHFGQSGFISHIDHIMSDTSKLDAVSNLG